MLPVEEVPNPSSAIINAMGIMNTLHGEDRTFSELSDHVFSQMHHAGPGIDVVFDVYTADSIKSPKLIQRGSTEGIAFSNIMPGHKINNWRRFLSCTESKDTLTAFLAESWTEQKFREKLGRKCMIVTSSDRCIKLTESGWQEIEMTFNLHKNISCKHHISNAVVCNKIQTAIGPRQLVPTTVLTSGLCKKDCFHKGK